MWLPWAWSAPAHGSRLQRPDTSRASLARKDASLASSPFLSGGNRSAFQECLKSTDEQQTCVRAHAHHRFLPSIMVTGTASRSNSSNRRALTPTLGLSKSGLPVDQSGDSE